MTNSLLRKRLPQAEDSFSTASNEHLMEEFEYALTMDLMKATSANRMTQEGITLADTVSSRVASLRKTFVEYTIACDDINLSFEQDLERIIEEHNYKNHYSHPHLSKEILHSIPTPYIKEAYSWLMQNLFNPYPPKEVRDTIARKTGSDPKHVENWFGDARKRMGWNAIRKRHFSNKRQLTVTAATAFFGGQSSELLTDMVRQDLATMSADAEDMYSKKFIESNLARRIDCVIPSPRDQGCQLASIESEGSPSRCYSASHSSLPRTQCMSRKHSRSSDLTDDTPDTNKKRPRLSYSSKRSLDSSPSPLSTISPRPESPVPHVIPADLKNCRTSESEDCRSPRHPSIDSRSLGPRTVPDPIRLSCDHNSSSSSSSTLSSDVPDESVTFHHTINRATKRNNPISMASFPRSPILHSSTLSLPANLQSASMSSRKENTQFPIEVQPLVPCDDSVVRQGFGLALPASNVTHDSPFQGSTIDDHLVATSSEFTSRTLSSAEDANHASWPATITNTQTDGQVFGYFDSLPMELTSTALVNALPPFTDVDVSFGDLFDLDAGATFPLSDPDVNGVFPVDGAENWAINDLLTLTPAVENSMAKLLQLEQLKKRKNRIQEYINLLEHQIAGTLVA